MAIADINSILFARECVIERDVSAAGAKKLNVAGLLVFPAEKIVRWPWRLKQISGWIDSKALLKTMLSGCVKLLASLFKSTLMIGFYSVLHRIQRGPQRSSKKDIENL